MVRSERAAVALLRLIATVLRRQRVNVVRREDDPLPSAALQHVQESGPRRGEKPHLEARARGEEGGALCAETREMATLQKTAE